MLTPFAQDTHMQLDLQGKHGTRREERDTERTMKVAKMLETRQIGRPSESLLAHFHGHTGRTEGMLESDSPERV